MGLSKLSQGRPQGIQGGGLGIVHKGHAAEFLNHLQPVRVGA